MTKRQIKVAQLGLEFLNDQSGPVVDVIVHAGINEAAHEYIPLTEVNAFLERADRDGWIATIGNQFKGPKRVITDLGKAKLQEMR